MKSFTHGFTLLLVVVGLMEIVYFGGRFLMTGSVLGDTRANPYIVVASVKAGGFIIPTAYAEASAAPTPNKVMPPAASPVAPVAEMATPAPTATAPAPITPVPEFNLATYTPSLENGAKISGKCKACHTFDAGGKNRIGPNLWGIFNKDIASTENVKYSPALTNLTGTWNDEALNAFLKSPRTYAKGTKMAFPGIKKPEQRADLIAWLKTLK